MDEMFRMVAENTRFPKLVLGDIESQIAGCIAGRDMMQELVHRYGVRPVPRPRSSNSGRAAELERCARHMLEFRMGLSGELIPRRRRHRPDKPVAIEVEVR